MAGDVIMKQNAMKYDISVLTGWVPPWLITFEGVETTSMELSLDIGFTVTTSMTSRELAEVVDLAFG